MRNYSIVFAALLALATCATESLAGDTHRSPGKPLGALQVKTPDTFPVLSVGAKMRVTLELQTAQASEVDVEWFAPSGLRVLSAAPLRLNLPAGQEKPLALEVAAEREGRFLLRVLLRTRINGETQTRSIALPLNTTQADRFTQKKVQSEKKDAEGRAIVELPASR